MLSYVHEFHAGSKVDVHKHSVLVLILDYLLQKNKPLTYIDTHAGSGVYDLTSARAQKTAEASAGVLALDLTAPPPALQPYVEVLLAFNPSGSPLRWYPGSPAIAAHKLA